MPSLKDQDHYGESLLEESDQHNRYPKPGWSKKSYIFMLLNAALLTLAVHLLILMRWCSKEGVRHQQVFSTSSSPSIVYSPFRDAIKYQIDTLPPDAWDNSLYIGPPSHEREAAWTHLLAVNGMRITSAEAIKLNFSSGVHLRGGEQASIQGYEHALHCIRYLYQGLHPDYYQRDEEDTAHAGGLTHSYHCLEVLRSSIVCNPDLSPYEIFWTDHPKMTIMARAPAQRQCIDFDAIQDFAKSRMYHRNDIVD